MIIKKWYICLDPMIIYGPGASIQVLFLFWSRMKEGWKSYLLVHFFNLIRIPRYRVSPFNRFLKENRTGPSAHTDGVLFLSFILLRAYSSCKYFISYRNICANCGTNKSKLVSPGHFEKKSCSWIFYFKLVNFLCS